MQHELNIKIANLAFGGPEKGFFTCPECGGGRFGTVRDLRQCHNEVCNWEGKPEDCVKDYVGSIENTMNLLLELEEMKYYTISYCANDYYPNYIVQVGDFVCKGDDLSETICSAIVKFLKRRKIHLTNPPR